MHMWGGTQLEEGGRDVSELWISECICRVEHSLRRAGAM